MSEPIRFYFQGQIQQVDDVAPTRTILQHLREDRHCSGTKEGCAEGDCGACTVVIGELKDGKLEMKSVNSCIQFAPTLDGKALFSVEDMQQPDGALHPVQQALVECHGSQCGFCTPGFVMSLWGMYLDKDGQPAQRHEIDDCLSGNLCRCTGYRPIIDAAQRMTELPKVGFDRAALTAQLQLLQREGGKAITAAALARLKPPRNTARRRRQICSQPVSSAKLQSNVARRVCWRGRALFRPRVSRRKLSSICTSRPGRPKRSICAATSSIARGMPSRRWQISMASGSSASLRAKLS